MKFNRRELVLLAATLLVVLGGLSVWIGEPLLKQWDEAGQARVRLENDRKEATHIINQREEWAQRLVAQRASMPQHGENEQVTAGILRTIKQLADANRITISRLQPMTCEISFCDGAGSSVNVPSGSGTACASRKPLRRP